MIQVGSFLIDLDRQIGAEGEFGKVYLAQEIPEGYDMSRMDASLADGGGNASMLAKQNTSTVKDRAGLSHNKSGVGASAVPGQNSNNVSMNNMNNSILHKSRSFMNDTSMNGAVAHEPHDYDFAACKVIQKSLVNAKKMKIIENEIMNQDRIASSYVVKLRKAVDTEESLYIFQEYCNGGDLKELFEAKDYDVPLTVVHKIARQIL